MMWRDAWRPTRKHLIGVSRFEMENGLSGGVTANIADVRSGGMPRFNADASLWLHRFMHRCNRATPPRRPSSTVSQKLIEAGRRAPYLPESFTTT